MDSIITIEHDEWCSSRHRAVLSDEDIKKEMKNGNIIIYNPEREIDYLIGNSSVDVTLGPYYYENTEEMEVFNPWRKGDTDRYWGSGKMARFPANLEESEKYGVPMDQRFILVKPKGHILGHTMEFIGGVNFITTEMKAKSSVGRSCITVCRDAGWGDIRYINRWTMEITNNSEYPLIFIVGKRIAQIVFYYTGPTFKPYAGKYQSSFDLPTLIETWVPEMMLPKLYLDKI